MEKAVVWLGVEAGDALGKLGLDEPSLLMAVRAGLEARSLCTLNHPPGFRGLSGWAETVRALRERKTIDKWARDNRMNLATVVNPEGWLSIAVATGDAATGLLDGMPRTKYEKGPSIIAAIDDNQVAFTFAAKYRKRDPEADPSTRVTWILLVHWGESEVRAELSLPLSVDADGYVDRWMGRIILTPIPVEPQPIQIEDAGQDVDVPVQRKS